MFSALRSQDSDPPRSPRIISSLLAACALALGTACAGEPPAGPASEAADGSTAPGAPAGAAPIFEDRTTASGLDFRHEGGMSGQKWFVEMMGSGLALLDYDRDGDLDLYLVQGHALDVQASPVAPPGDRLYRNDLLEDPEGGLAPRFVDVTTEAGLAATGYGMGVTAGDVDGDGWPDLYVTNWGPNQLWLSDGAGGFVDASDRVDDPVAGWSTSAVMLDYDRDGWLDIFVTNYVRYSLAQDVACFAGGSGRRDYCSPAAYPPAPDALLRNRGDGSFENVSYRLGMAERFGPGLGVAVADFDDDGWPDIYVANDGADNQLWMNQAGQRFEDRAPMAGGAVNRAGLPEASMGVAAADFDGDADLDLFMTHLMGETNTLYANDGAGRLEDVSQPAGLAQASTAFTAFGTAPLDLDNDGWQDLAITTGLVVIDPEQDAAGDPLPLRQPDQLFLNLGQGRFEDASGRAGPAFARPTIGRGLVEGDLDNDGDGDLVISDNHGPARVLINQLGQDQPWLGLDLRLSPEGREGYGARVELLREGQVLALRQVQPGGSYASSGDPRLRFGLGALPEPDGLRVRWPDGSIERWPAPAAGAYHRLVQGQGESETNP